MTSNKTIARVIRESLEQWPNYRHEDLCTPFSTLACRFADALDLEGAARSKFVRECGIGRPPAAR